MQQKETEQSYKFNITISKHLQERSTLWITLEESQKNTIIKLFKTFIRCINPYNDVDAKIQLLYEKSYFMSILCSDMNLSKFPFDNQIEIDTNIIYVMPYVKYLHHVIVTYQQHENLNALSIINIFLDEIKNWIMYSLSQYKSINMITQFRIGARIMYMKAVLRSNIISHNVSLKNLITHICSKLSEITVENYEIYERYQFLNKIKNLDMDHTHDEMPDLEFISE